METTMAITYNKVAFVFRQAREIELAGAMIEFLYLSELKQAIAARTGCALEKRIF